MGQVQKQIVRQKSAKVLVKPEVQAMFGDDAESSAILNSLVQQPSIVDLLDEQENTLVTMQYVFKSIDADKDEITCLDDEYHDITFDLDPTNKELLGKINKLIEEGKKQKKDVKIIVSQLNDTETVSDAKLD